MRTLLLLMAVFALPGLLAAQENESFLIRAKIKPGAILVGGSVSASVYKVTDEVSIPGIVQEKTNILAAARLKNGYFVLPDFAVGLDITFSHESMRVDTDTNTEVLPRRRTYLLAGPFTRYYLDNGIFGELALKGGLLNFSSGNKFDVYEGTASVGYAYFINEKFSIEPILSIRYYKEVEKKRSYTSYGPMLGVGVQAYLLRKKAHVIKKAL